jgi:hypothetical protein
MKLTPIAVEKTRLLASSAANSGLTPLMVALIKIQHV